MNSFERWKKAWEDIGAKGDPEDSFFALQRRYFEKHRRYHGWSHIEECFEELSEIEHLVENPAEVAIGLGEHDVFYDVYQKDSANVEQSADHADNLLKNAGVIFPRRTTTRGIILSTKHLYMPKTLDQEYATDIDKAMLGKNWERYSEYIDGIRYEFRHVPDEIFKVERPRIMGRFLKRRHIYSTAHFQDKYEGQARENIQRELRML